MDHGWLLARSSSSSSSSSSGGGGGRPALPACFDGWIDLAYFTLLHLLARSSIHPSSHPSSLCKVKPSRMKPASEEARRMRRKARRTYCRSERERPPRFALFFGVRVRATDRRIGGSAAELRSVSQLWIASERERNLLKVEEETR